MNKFVYILILILVISTFVKAQKTIPCDIEIDKKAQKLYDKARKANSKGDKAKETEYYLAAIEIQDDWVAPYYQLGMQIAYKIEIQTQDFEKLYPRALEYLEKAVSLCPDYNPAAYFYLGKIYYNIAVYEKAVIHLEKFLQDLDRINPQDMEKAEELLTFSELYDKMYNHPVPFEPTPVIGISSADDEYLATISPDNDYFLFTRRKMVSLPQRYSGKDKMEYREIFTISQRQPDGNFDYGKDMEEPFNKSKNEGGPTITVDNKYMVFTKCVDVLLSPSSDKTYYNCDLYFSENIDGYWTPTTNLGKNINREDTWESQASISPDGQTLYFVSDREGGVGGYDIYFSTRDVSGNWQIAQNLGPSVNSKENDKAPYIHSDNKTLYFSSTGYPGLGGYDIYISRLAENGQWKRPVNIGYPINSENDDVGLFVNTFGNKAYFASNRFSSSYDICEFDLYTEAQPQKVLLVKGEVYYDRENAADIEMKLQNVSNKKMQSINVDKISGKYAFIINETEDDYVLSVKQQGAVHDLHYIASKELLVEGKQELSNFDMKLDPIEVGNSYKINDIYFATNSSELTEQSKHVIEILIDFMNDNPGIEIEIQGHTDNIGQRSDNMILSENRAKEVYYYLIERHIESSRLTYKGFADTMPVADNATNEGRALNRRTVFVILSK